MTRIDKFAFKAMGGFLILFGVAGVGFSCWLGYETKTFGVSAITVIFALLFAAGGVGIYRCSYE